MAHAIVMATVQTTVAEVVVVTAEVVVAIVTANQMAHTAVCDLKLQMKPP
jgi:hypothetical protein